MSHKFKKGDIVKLKQFPPKPIGGWMGSFLDYFKNAEDKFKVTGLGTYNFTGTEDLCISLDLPNYGGWNPEKAFELYEEPKKSLVGRYLKALIDKPNGASYKKDEIILISKEINDANKVNCTKGFIFSHENYDFTQSEAELMPENFIVYDSINIKEIQKICIEKYPIGCSFRAVDDCASRELKLLNDDFTYKIVGNFIFAHNNGGLLYKNGKWAELISLPKNPELTEEPVTVKKSVVVKHHDFKVGDYVEVIAESHGWGNIEYGNIGVVKAIYNTTLDVDFEFQKDWTGTFDCFVEVLNKPNIPIKQEVIVPHTKEQAFDSPVLLNKIKKQNKIIVL
jgi:hypothetical protein